jgi:MFS transporter, DHA1 family, solute carrier family 18 (vesicular amine transporter), member 1/2
LLLYGLIFVSSLVSSAVVPLLPDYVSSFHVSAFDASLLVSLPTLVMLGTVVPLGLLGSAYGPAPVTLGGAVILAGSCFWQAFAGSFASLLAGRLLFGIALTVAWTTAVAWLEAGALEQRTRALGAIGPVTGLGFVLGPWVSGLLAGWLGLAAPFALFGAASMVILLGLLPHAQRERPREARPARRRRHAVVHAVRDRGFAVAVVGLAMIGLAGGVANAVGPIALSRGGLSVGVIGTIVGLSAVLYVLGGAVTLRLSRRLVSALGAALAILALGLTFIPAAASVSTIAISATLLAYMLVRGAITTICYPLAASHGRRAGLQTSTAVATANAAWAAASALGPPIGAGLLELQGTRSAFAAILAVAVIASGAFLVAGRGPRPTVGS